MAASPRAARVRRALAVSSTAVALVVVAAACGTAAASTDSQESGRSTEAGHSQHGGNPADAQDDGDRDNARDNARDNDGDNDGDGGNNGDRGSGRDNGREGDRGNGGGRNGDRNQVENGNNGNNGNGNNGNGNNGNGNGNNGNNNGNGNGNNPPASSLDILGTDCSNSDLEPHDGFQKAPRCVETSFGEVTSADKSPSLLITEAPSEVGVDQDFELVVSTRNLKRDRFLGAAVGGYYAEASFLDDNGIQRGHFHTACRFLPSVDAAPDASPEPAFFLATQDNQGGAGEDKVTIDVPGQDQAGTLQCAVWAGDGSHRVPMMERANQTPAFDVVRITVQ
ncbi:hypothetical protein [Pseudonocardia sp.]|uniref:hypothetical protein n=1 Tax=Pseudonocardia sp. TaxID=60912 RepID=UPI003D0B7806